MNVRRNDQLRVPPPGTQREPTDASALPLATAARSRTRSAGSCEKSASISKMYVVVARERPQEALDVRRPQAAFAVAVHDVDAAARRRASRSAMLPGAVGRVVVDDQHVEVGGLAQNGRHDGLDVLALVVGGQDDERRPAECGDLRRRSASSQVVVTLRR